MAKLTTEMFIAKAKESHTTEYDYSKVVYEGKCSKVTIICPKHGEFVQEARVHLRGSDCPRCAKENANMVKTSTYQMFLEKARNVHGDKYNYIEESFSKMRDSVTIICPLHGEFSQRAQSHIDGRGCPKCRESKLEKEVKDFLIKESIDFEEQKTFDWLTNSKTGRKLHCDFYLPKMNIAIECQGSQHFSKGRTFAQDKTKYERTIQCDDEKNRLCRENGVKILYFANNEFYIKGYRYPVITELEKLLA
jgi:very-short-patch-repair endonuclease